MKDENEKEKEQQKEKSYYVLNLDLNRIFWIVISLLIVITMLFLFGYWLGIDNKKGNEGVTNLEEKTRSLQDFYKKVNDNFNETDYKNEIQTANLDSSTKLEEKKKEEIKKENSKKDNFSYKGSNEEETKKVISKSEKGKKRSENKIKNIVKNKSKIKQEEKDFKDDAENLALKKDNPQVKNKKKNYTIQVSSHLNKDTANNIVDILQNKNFDAYISPYAIENSKIIYRIRVGYFSDKKKAEETLSNLIIVGDVKDIDKSKIVPVH